MTPPLSSSNMAPCLLLDTTLSFHFFFRASASQRSFPACLTHGPSFPFIAAFKSSIPFPNPSIFFPDSSSFSLLKVLLVHPLCPFGFVGTPARFSFRCLLCSTPFLGFICFFLFPTSSSNFMPTGSPPSVYFFLFGLQVFTLALKCALLTPLFLITGVLWIASQDELCGDPLRSPVFCTFLLPLFPGGRPLRDVFLFFSSPPPPDCLSLWICLFFFHVPRFSWFL